MPKIHSGLMEMAELRDVIERAEQAKNVGGIDMLENAAPLFDEVRLNKVDKGYSVSFLFSGKVISLCYSRKNKARSSSGELRYFSKLSGAIGAIKQTGYSGDVVIEV